MTEQKLILQKIKEEAERRLDKGETFAWEDFFAKCVDEAKEKEQWVETFTNLSLQGERQGDVETSDISEAFAVTLDSEHSAGVVLRDELPREETFGKYQLIRLLGQGGMGVVWLAYDPMLGRNVALKMLRPSSNMSAELLERFRQEARSVASLRHPNIITIHEVGEWEGQLYFSMEYIRGQELSHLIAKETLPARRCAKLFASIVKAVSYIHQEGWVHRDLKPSNVLINEDGEPILMDFGIAKSLTTDKDDKELTRTGAIIGTPGYIAPELLPPNAVDVTPRSDIYGLGAILYKMLTGRAPYEGESALSILQQSIESAPLPPRLLRPDLPEDLEAICMKCLEREVDQRYKDASALGDDLDCFVQGRSVRAKKRSAFSQIARLLVRGTEHQNLMKMWGPIWRINALQFLGLFLLSQVLVTTRLDNAFLLSTLWCVGFASILLVAWYLRRREKVRFSSLERQMVKIVVIFALQFLLIAVFNAVVPVSKGLGPGGTLPPFFLVPIVQLATAAAFACMAVVLGGEFFIMAIPCAVLAFVMPLFSEWTFLIYGLSLTAGMFLPFIRYNAQHKASDSTPSS